MPMGLRSLSTEEHEFQAETRKLLDIVTNSIYTDKEVFLRELISNASDALEKLRYNQTTGAVAGDGEPLCITITTDAEAGTLTIADSGIGMSKDELMNNLGTIARSGSKNFVEEIESGDQEAATSDIIGQFGVGFYSAFMVSDSVTVTSSRAGPAGSGGDAAYSWTSDGSGRYSISEATGAKQGCSIQLTLKESCKEYIEADRIKDVIKKYSNFVSFPIEVNGDVVNTVSAVWLRDKNSVEEAEYEEFYKFLANAYDKPMFTLHFQADAPIDMKTLFFIPTFHTEKFGMGRMEPGVSLYSRKVLIEDKPSDLLPDWLRFVKGVVDSEDLPLSISRERPQDSALLKRIRDVLTRKLVRFLGDQARNDPEKFREFYVEFNYFLKEGICHDYQFQDQIAKLLMFESSQETEHKLSSLDDYIARCPPDQKEIYYHVAPSRAAALASPYMETFVDNNKDVLLMYSGIDEFVMSNLKTYNGRKLVSAETGSVNVGDDEADKSADDASKDGKERLSDEEAALVCGWLRDTLGDHRVREVRVTDRLSGSPAIITDHESGALRRMMQMVDQTNANRDTTLPPQVLEVNPKHPIIQGLNAARIRGDEEAEAKRVASLVANQLMDNALVAAGLLDDPRSMLPRLNDILAASLK